MSPQKKVFIFISIFAVVASLVAYGMYYISTTKNVDMMPPADATPVTLSCSNGYSGTATYYDKDERGVMKRLLFVSSQGETIKRYFMYPAVSASGAKFQTSDGLVALWEHQGEFSFEENGVRVALCKDKTYTTFLLDGEELTLVNGTLEKETAPGSVTKEIFSQSKDEVKGDINGDEKEDQVLFVTRQGAGSGVFLYVFGMLATEALPKSTKALLIGDRIIFEKAQIQDGILAVTYLDRKPEESFTVAPSVKKVLHLKLDTIAFDFGEVVKEAEGDMDTSRMTLSMQPWKWTKTTYSDEKEVFPKSKDAFVATFSNDGRASFSTDCNTMNAEYTVIAEKISFGPMVSTKKFCENAQEGEYASMLLEVEGFSFTSRGELVITLKKKSGTMLFK